MPLFTCGACPKVMLGVERTRESAVKGRVDPKVVGGTMEGPAVRLFGSPASRLAVPNLGMRRSAAMREWGQVKSVAKWGTHAGEGGKAWFCAGHQCQRHALLCTPAKVTECTLHPRTS